MVWNKHKHFPETNRQTPSESLKSDHHIYILHKHPEQAQ